MSGSEVQTFKVRGVFTAGKVSKYGVLSGPYFPVFSPNPEIYGLEKSSVFGHFSRSDSEPCQTSEMGRFRKLVNS